LHPLDCFLSARDFLFAHRADYEAACRGFAWPRFDRFNWALDYFDAIARGNSRPALRLLDENGAETNISFEELAERSNCAANYLRANGVTRGDRILVMLGNEPAMWEILLAAFKAGAVVIPAASQLGADDLRDRLDRGGVRHVVAGSAHAEKFAALAGGYTRIVAGPGVRGWRSLSEAGGASRQFRPDGETRASDPLLLYFTSGTTSRPKLVQHSHVSYPVGHLSTMYWLGLRADDVHWNISSPGWAKHAWSCFFAPWNAGATVFASNYTRFRPADALETLVKKGITTLCAPPTVWRMLVQEKLADYAVTLRDAASAGEPLNPEVMEQVSAAWGIAPRDGYGQTETTTLIGNSPGQAIVPGSMGRPMPGFRIELSDEGEICLDLSDRPAGLMLGYAGDPHTEALRDGRYHTGDIAVRSEEGRYTYVGRRDDVFKASDYRISPFELESALIEHPAVAEAAVVPCPDPVRGFIPKAFILLAPGYRGGEELAREIFVFIRRTLAPYKRIRRIEFSDLPKTISGKIRRGELRKYESERAAQRGALEFFEEDFLELP
jgi:acetyl-CoA synthetase